MQRRRPVEDDVASVGESGFSDSNYQQSDHTNHFSKLSQLEEEISSLRRQLQDVNNRYDEAQSELARLKSGSERRHLLSKSGQLYWIEPLLLLLDFVEKKLATQPSPSRLESLLLGRGNKHIQGEQSQLRARRIADHCTSLAKERYRNDPFRMLLLASLADALDPQPVRRKWLGFRLYHAGLIDDAKEALSPLHGKIRFSHSEQRAWERLLAKTRASSSPSDRLTSEVLPHTGQALEKHIAGVLASDTVTPTFSSIYPTTNKKCTPWSKVDVSNCKKLTLEVECAEQIPEKSLIAAFRFFDVNDQEASVAKDVAYHSDIYRWFRYIPVTAAQGSRFRHSVDVEVGPNVNSIAISLVNIGEADTTALRVWVEKEEQNGLSTEPQALHTSVFSYLQQIRPDEPLDAETIIYGDVNPNVLDGSSIWLTSIANIISNNTKSLLLLKDDVRSSYVIDNIVRNNNITIIEPKHLGLSSPLSPEQAADAVAALYYHCPSVTSVVSRGLDVSYALQNKKSLSNVLFPYITDFYQVTDGGIQFPHDKIEKLQPVCLNARGILYQTPHIIRKMREVVGLEVAGTWLPPTVPQYVTDLRGHQRKAGPAIHIGYAGKIQPGWGVAELIEEVERQIASGRRIHLHIATGKVSGGTGQHSGFLERARRLLSKEFVTVYESLPRRYALELMAEMDLLWCYRSPWLEDNTLELSTKLVETAGLERPCIAYPSKINRSLLGDSYPYFIKTPDGIGALISRYLTASAADTRYLQDLSRRVCRNHTFEAVASSVAEALRPADRQDLQGKKITVSGHDLKFIYPYVSNLRKRGAQVAIDPWEWGNSINLDISEFYSSWADYIFCEWGLANAVWQSGNKKASKRLVVRVHAQEVRPKAKKFGNAIDNERVDKFVFVSANIREQAADIFGWQREQTAVVPNGVKQNRFFKAAGELRPVLGMVGIVPTTKRLDRALDLLAALNKRGWNAKLYCKGHRPEALPFMHAPGRRHELTYYEQLYQDIAAKPELNGNVIFDGWGNDIERWYQKVDFILSPSDNESFHYALADGVVAGCIPLVWPWEGAAEVYSGDWIVRDTDEAVVRIEHYLCMEPKALNESRKGFRQLVLDRYAESRIFEGLDECLFGRQG